MIFRLELAFVYRIMKSIYIYNDTKNQNSTEISFLKAKQIQEITEESFLDLFKDDILLKKSDFEDYCSKIQKIFKDSREKLVDLKKKQEQEAEDIKKLKENLDIISNYDNIFLKKEDDLDKKILSIEQKLLKREKRATFSNNDESLLTSEVIFHEKLEDLYSKNVREPTSVYRTIKGAGIPNVKYSPMSHKPNGYNHI